MKKFGILTLTLCLVLGLTACGATTLPTPEEPTPPAVADTEDITYEVTTDPYEQDILAEDGTKLMHISFQLPHLQAYVNGQPIETPATPAQEAAVSRMNTFNESFDQWRESESVEESIADTKMMYQEDPELFTGDSMAPLSEELTYTCYRTGSLISIAADYYSYLGGAHPNTVYFSWNFDLDSGIFLAIPELAEDPQAFTLAVADMIEVQAVERFQSDPNYAGLSLSDIYGENYREVMEKWASDYAVSFDAEGMTIIFSAYELASYAAGPQEFHFSYEQLASYWSESGRTVLGLNLILHRSKKVPGTRCVQGTFFYLLIRRFRSQFSCSIRSLMALPVGVAARPPSAVSRSSIGIRVPTSPMQSITSSTGMRLSIPASAISAQLTALTAPTTFRFTQGTSTSPATGSHTRPIKFFSAMAAAWPICLQSPPRREASAPAAMAEAEPISA